MDIGNDVLRAMNGDNQAMERMYNATYPKLRAVTMSILKNEDDAEDIIQDTYVKAFTNLGQLDDAEKFDAWLCRIASNKCKDYLKKHKPVLFSDMSSGDEDEDPYEWSIEDENEEYNPEAVAISDDTRRQLMEIINTLPDEQRICLVYNAVADGEERHEDDVEQTYENDGRNDKENASDKMPGEDGADVEAFKYDHRCGYVEGCLCDSTCEDAKHCECGLIAVECDYCGEREPGDIIKTDGDYLSVCYDCVRYLEDDAAMEDLNSMIDFDETVILDEEDYSIKVLNVRIDENNNYILESEVTNKLNNDILVHVYQCFIDGVYSNSSFSVVSRSELDDSRIEAKKTVRADIVVHNPDLVNFYKDYSEIKLRLQHTEVDGFDVLENHKSVYAASVYPFGKENKKEFMIGDNYNQLIYNDSNVSIYTVDFLAVENNFDDFYCTTVFYIENKTDVGMYYTMDNLLINGQKVSIHYVEEKMYKNDYIYNVNASYDEAYIPQSSSVFYKISFRLSDVRDDVDIWSVEEIETIQFDGKMFEASQNSKNIYFEDVIRVNPEIMKEGYTVIVNCDYCYEMRSGEVISDYGYGNSICHVCKEELEEDFD